MIPNNRSFLSKENNASDFSDKITSNEYVCKANCIIVSYRYLLVEPGSSRIPCEGTSGRFASKWEPKPETYTRLAEPVACCIEFKSRISKTGR